MQTIEDILQFLKTSYIINILTLRKSGYRIHTFEAAFRNAFVFKQTYYKIHQPPATLHEMRGWWQRSFHCTKCVTDDKYYMISNYI